MTFHVNFNFFMFLAKNSKLQNNKRGFSMMEVVFSVFILSVGLVAAIGLIVSSIKNSIDSRNHIIASQLAQEGVELVRNVRDNSWADGKIAFLDFKSGIGKDNCIIDKDSDDVKTCAASPDHKKLYYFNDFYVHNDDGSETRFQRRIKLEYYDASGDPTPPNKDAIKASVKSIVTWNNSAPPSDLSNCSIASKCIYIEDILVDW